MAPRIFLSFAEEDKPYREFLVTPARMENRPVEFVDTTPKRVRDQNWRNQTRRAVEGCDAVIALLSWKTLTAEGAKWEMRCALEARLPMIGIYLDGERKATVPPEMEGRKVLEWSWEEIAAFLDDLKRKPVPAA